MPKYVVRFECAYVIEAKDVNEAHEIAWDEYSEEDLNTEVSLSDEEN
jgi:hypothetical protein